MNWLKGIQAGFYMLGWFERAAKDGEITQDEMIDLVSNVIAILGIRIRIKVPNLPLGGSNT